jgi:colicin import membrane protein
MSQAEARSWWADVEHLREAAERRQAADAEERAREQRAADRRARADAETNRARTRAATRVRDASGGAVDELSARRAVVLDERAPRARRPAPIWLADDAFADPIATARARAAAPRRTVEIRGQVAMPATPPERAPAPMARRHRSTGLASSFAARPDRLAFWAFAMGLMLALVAAMSGGHA